MDKPLIRIPLLLLALALPVSIAGTNAALGLLTIGILAAAATSPREIRWRLIKNPAVYAALAYALVGVFVSLLGVDVGNSLPQLYRDFHKFWVLGLLLIALGSVSTRGLELALGCGFGFAALAALAQEISGQFLNGGRAHAFVHPVTFGEQMALAFGGGLCFLSCAEAGSGKPARKPWMLVFLGLCGAALLFNQTRGALLGLAAGFLALSWVHKPLRRKLFWVIGYIVLVALAWELFYGHRGFLSAFHPLGRSDSGETKTRLVLWSVAVKILRDNPLTGVGIGNYKTVFSQYFQGSLEGLSVWGSAHNLYLHQLAERGLLGFASLCLFLGTLALGAWRGAAESPDAWNLWSFVAITAFLVMNITEVAFQNEQVATLMLFIWARAKARERGTE